jgi:hypothetical protein
VIKLKRILTEQATLYKGYVYNYDDKDPYIYAIKNGEWWSKNRQTGKEFNISTNPAWKSSIDKLDKKFPKAAQARKQQANTDNTDNNNTDNNIQPLAVRRNKNGWMSPKIEIQKLSAKSYTTNWRKLFDDAVIAAKNELKQQLVGKTIKVRYPDKYVPVFNEDWRQYDLSEFNERGWPTDADQSTFKPATISGQRVGDVYVLMSYTIDRDSNVTAKFECSVVYVGGKVKGWIPTSYIDVA